jgi:hypothetical protein
MDAFIIAFSNVIFSFVAGIGLFAVIGNLESIASPNFLVKTSQSIFYAPFAEVFSSMDDPNIWSIIFYFMLSAIGLTTMLTFLYGAMITYMDSPWGKRRGKICVAFLICLIGEVTSVFYSFDTGAFIQDLVAHYVMTYSVMITLFF